MKNGAKETPLHVAAISGCVPIVDALIGAGADVNASGGTSGQVPLFMAAERGHALVIASLLAAGANVGVKDVCIGLVCFVFCVTDSTLFLFLLATVVNVDVRPVRTRCCMLQRRRGMQPVCRR